MAKSGAVAAAPGPRPLHLLPSWAQLQTLLHLCAWCQIGVLVRIEADALFGGACAAGGKAFAWAPCVTSPTGALLYDLPPNMIGSFIMGFLASSDVLAKHLGHTLATAAPLAAIPRGSSLQAHTALQVGLRTGFCGSLTTFSSWILQAVVMLVGAKPLTHSKWVEGLASLALNVWVCMAALVTGQHMCLLAYHRLNPGAFSPRGEYGWRGTAQPPQPPEREPPAPGERLLVVEDRRTSSLLKGPAEARATAAAVARELARAVSGAAEVREPAAAAAAAGGGGEEEIELVRAASEAAVVRVSSCELPRSGGGGGGWSGGGGAGAAAGGLRRQSAASVGSAASGAVQPTAKSAGDVAASPFAIAAAGSIGDGGGADAAAAPPEVATELVVLEEAEVGYPFGWWVSDALAAASLMGFTTAAIVICAKLEPSNRSPFGQTSYAIAVLVGPAGCLLRFYLSRLNGSLPGRWKWFPAGTFAANMIACLVNFSIRAGVDRSNAPHPLLSAALAGVQTGFSGSLSTVSTWVVELQLLMLGFPAQSRGYGYLCLSIGAGVTLGVVILGVATWVP